MIITFCTLLFCVVSEAQTTRYVSPSGTDAITNGTIGSPYKTINYAVTKCVTGDIVKALPGTYNEQVTINKSITLDGQDSSKCIITFSGTTPVKVASIYALFGVTAANVTIKNFKFITDLTKINSAIGSSSAASNMLITGNEILSYLSVPGAYFNGYSYRNGIVLTGSSNVIIKSNTFDSRNGGTFRAAIQSDNAINLQIGGTSAAEGNNFLASVNHDALIRSYQGTILLSNNNFDGGGVEVSVSKGTAAGSFTVSNNTFDGTYAHTIPTAMVRIFTNADSLMAINFSYNHFINQKWTVSFENTRNVTLDHNDFTAAYDSFRLISVNTKLRQSTPVGILETIDIKLTNNDLSANAGLTTGNGLEFLNFDERKDTDNYIKGNYVIGTLGNENNFNANIPTFVYVSNLNGLNTNGIDSVFLKLYPEYQGTQVPSVTGYWARDIFARYNRYYINGALKLASDFSATDFKETYKKIFDRKNDVNIGAVVLMPTWSGATSTDWSDSTNWSYKFTPRHGLDAVVYPQPKQPQLTQDAECDTLIIYRNMGLSTGTHNLTIFGNIRSNGTIEATTGSVILGGTTMQTLTGLMRIRNLSLNNPVGANIETGDSNQVVLTGTYNPGSQGVLVTNDNLVLNSDSSGTASIGKGTGNYINGQVTFERYVNTGTGIGQHGKSWQLLSTPVSGTTIKGSWMENGANTPGYGIQVTGPGGTTNGFDMYSAAPSLKYYDYNKTNWVGITSTSDSINDLRGYMVFVRGDRTVTGAKQAATATILRSKGNLFVGQIPSINLPGNGFQTVANPYACPVDFTLITTSANVDNKFYSWDPYLWGSYGVGAYQTFSSVTDWEPVPGGTLANPSGLSNSIIQSGQAFFVHTTTASNQMKTFGVLPAAITFSEDCKVAGGASVNFARKAERFAGMKRPALKVSLFTGPGANDVLADGNVVVFDNSYSNAVDQNDALKMNNDGENFGLKRNGKILAIEAHAGVTVSDTLFYNMTNLSKRAYQLRFATVNMQSSGLQAVLIDNFLKTETPISMSDSSFVNITVTSVAASGAVDRFKVVFRQLNSLPLTITSIVSSVKNDNDVVVSWNVQNESGILNYQLEKSIDGKNFSEAASLNAGNKGSGNYSWTDVDLPSGVYYYRVEATTLDGKISYTQIVKQTIGKQVTGILVYPNPIIENEIRMEFNSQPEGMYSLRLFNAGGQLVISKKISHARGSGVESIQCGSLSKGIYQLEVTKPDESKVIINIIN